VFFVVIMSVPVRGSPAGMMILSGNLFLCR